MVGYFSAPNAKRLEVLRIIATVLDFTSDERQKTGLADGASGLGGWATGLLKMSALRANSGNATSGDADKVKLVTPDSDLMLIYDAFVSSVAV